MRFIRIRAVASAHRPGDSRASVVCLRFRISSPPVTSLLDHFTLRLSAVCAYLPLPTMANVPTKPGKSKYASASDVAKSTGKQPMFEGQEIG